MVFVVCACVSGALCVVCCFVMECIHVFGKPNERCSELCSVWGLRRATSV